MPNALQIAGSQGSKPTRYAPILIHKFFKGLWTQRNPFSDAGTPFLVEKFYSGTSFDGLIDGLNVELTNKLTLRRRCGASVYNSQTFSPVNRFFEFRRVANNAEVIQVIADTATTVLDATGPSTKTTLFTKSTGAGQSSFVSVGSTLYFGNGVDQQKYLGLQAWQASATVAIGQVVQGGTSGGLPVLQYLQSISLSPGNITNIAVAGQVVTFTLNAPPPLLAPGMGFRIRSLSTATFLNGGFYSVLSVSGTTLVALWLNGSATYPNTADANGVIYIQQLGVQATNGATQPTWFTAYGSVTTDPIYTAGGLNWVSYGPASYSWAAKAPATAPAIGGVYNLIWQPATFYAGLLMDSIGMIWAANAGTSGSSVPKFANVPAGGTPPTITDNSISNASTLGWARSTWLGTTAGSISTPQPWKAGTTPHIIGTFAGGDVCIDSNGNLQIAATGSGATGGAAPTWNKTIGGVTNDSSLVWRNQGPYSALAFTGWKYAYAYHSVDGSLSTLTPLTGSTNAVLNGVSVNIVASTDPQVDSIWLFRTADGGSTPLFLLQLDNVTVTFNDLIPDAYLNFELTGPQFGVNNPPPAGFIPDCYHLGRIFGHVGATLYFSAGADTLVGNGNTSFPPANNFVMPSKINRCVPTAIGLLIFTTSGVYFSGIGGTNLDTPTAPAPFMDGKVSGLMSPNALDIVGSTIYLVNSKKKQLQIDIGGGDQETGFPIGDVLANGNPSTSTPAINPASCYVAWHEQDSTDSALYVATPGAANAAWWYRMNPAPAPESGIMWGSQAISAAGFSAMQSIETSPGVHQLLLGPPSGGTGPILKRDTTTFADNGTAYSAYADIGSIVLAHPGQVALIDFISTFCIAVGSRPTVSVLLGEIGGHAEMVAKGSALTLSVPEPPENGPAGAVTLYNDRWWMSASQQSALCQHLQIEIAWPAENQPNELLTYALFGAHYQEL